MTRAGQAAGDDDEHFDDDDIDDIGEDANPEAGVAQTPALPERSPARAPADWIPTPPPDAPATSDGEDWNILHRAPFRRTDPRDQRFGAELALLDQLFDATPLIRPERLGAVADIPLLIEWMRAAEPP